MATVAGLWLRVQNFRSAAPVPSNSTLQLGDSWCFRPKLFLVQFSVLHSWPTRMKMTPTNNFTYKEYGITCRLLDINKWGQEERLEVGASCCNIRDIYRYFADFAQVRSAQTVQTAGLVLQFCVILHNCRYLRSWWFFNFIYRKCVNNIFHKTTMPARCGNQNELLLVQFGGSMCVLHAYFAQDFRVPCLEYWYIYRIPYVKNGRTMIFCPC